MHRTSPRPAPSARALRARALWAWLLVAPWACAAQDAAGQRAGAWLSGSPGEDAQSTLVLKSHSLNEVQGWRAKSSPVLTIECTRGKAAAYFEAGLPLEVTPVDMHTVRVRFDDGDFVQQRWREVANATLASKDGASLIGRLEKSARFVVEFTPFGSGPVRAEFSLDGLAQYRRRMESACRAKP